MIYLDHNATTPVDARVLAAMLPYFSEQFGNPASTLHAYGWDAEAAVDESREQVADLIGARPQEIYFTSGATEAINLALLGIYEAGEFEGKQLITAVTEHRAVLDTCQHLAQRGVRVVYLPVDGRGQIDLAELARHLRQPTRLVCLMHANNETGVIHPLAEVSALARAQGAALMSDLTQSAGKIDCDVASLGVDLGALSAHKLYGPKGVGALYLRAEARVAWRPRLFGGGQEKGLRPGTLNVPGIVGLGHAAELAQQERVGEGLRLAALRNRLEQELLALGRVQVNGAGVPRLPHTTNVSFADLDGHRLVRSLKGLAVSQGSACSSALARPSHVLTAMGLPDERAFASLRFGLGRRTTAAEIEQAISLVRQAVKAQWTVGKEP